MERTIVASKFVRGHVWMVHEDPRVTNALLDSGDKGLCKTRPYLIIESNEDLAINQSRIWCMPITSKFDGVKRDGDILFRNANMDINRLCTNEIATKSSSMFMSYMFTMPDEIMAEVDMIILRRSGFGTTMRKLDMELRGYEDRIFEIRQQARNIMETQYNKMEQKKKNLAIPVEEEHNKSANLAEPQFVKELKEEKERKVVRKKEEKRRGPYRKWTIGDYERLVINSEGLDAPTLASLYDIDLSTLHKTKYYLTQKFKKVRMS